MAAVRQFSWISTILWVSLFVGCAANVHTTEDAAGTTGRLESRESAYCAHEAEPRQPVVPTDVLLWNVGTGHDDEGDPILLDNLVHMYWAALEPPEHRAEFMEWDLDESFPWTMDLLAERAARATRQMPPGSRVVFDFDLASDLDLDDPVWWEEGVRRVAGRYRAFLQAFKGYGGAADVWLIDFEDYQSVWNIGQRWMEAPDGVESGAYAARWRSIARDRRFEAEVRTPLSRDGMVFSARRAAEDVLLDSLYDTPDEGAKIAWNALGRERSARFLKEAACSVVREYFPDAQCSNYGHFGWDPRYALYDEGLKAVSDAGCGGIAGTHQALPMYHEMQSGRTLDGRLYGADPFEVFVYSVNRVRAAMLGSDAPMHLWFSHRDWNGSRLRRKDLYQEALLHAALAGAERFIYWNPRYEASDVTAPADDAQDRLVSDLFKEWDALLAGAAWKRTLVTSPADWDGRVVDSAVETDAFILHRVTADRAIVVRENGDKVVLSAGDRTLTFERARVPIAPSDSFAPAGVWVMQER